MQTYSAVNVCFSPHNIVLLVNNLWSAENMEIFHNILLHISQGRDLSKKPCENTQFQVINQREQIKEVFKKKYHVVYVCHVFCLFPKKKCKRGMFHQKQPQTVITGENRCLWNVSPALNDRVSSTAMNPCSLCTKLLFPDHFFCLMVSAFFFQCCLL